MVIPEDLNLDRILCIKTEGVLRQDFTVAYNKKLYQIKDNIRAKNVTVEEMLDGKIVITSNGVSLAYIVTCVIAMLVKCLYKHVYLYYACI
ncbi:hypothetical protein MBAV_003842 [Candidatus Magnetobacterium bavaricum]|uniref:Uncharacterized protein n=1 Tax=Candidatus Magnetobacterium bavaricum TaxID=29290 RepID=A0A0F3GPZ5_9BACT|nr:hypothetical protein MBAV_003842 [Candidatus Magnetobacterium bavaricum]